jgi:hypothetical protein
LLSASAFPESDTGLDLFIITFDIEIVYLSCRFVPPACISGCLNQQWIELFAAA